MKLAFVTRNKGKFREACRILESYGVELYLVELEKREIQSDDVGEIALNAAVQAYSVVRAPLLIDDTGLFIEALRGFPGPYAEYAYRTLGLEGILKLMLDEHDRRAYFETAVAIVLPPWERVFKERVDGRITERPRGNNGFGYDPIFIPHGHTKTYAEMSLEEKNNYSHRGRALRRAGKWLRMLMDKRKI